MFGFGSKKPPSPIPPSPRSAIYLGLLAVLPSTLQRGLGVTTFYLGSTSLLIVVGVALDTMTQIEARPAMRDYTGFIKR